MATVQAILDDINLIYRNTYTNDQKLVWMNEEQRELFEVLEIDSVPFSFPTVAGSYLYPIPDGVEKDRIKVMTIQTNDSATDPNFIEIPWMENDNRRYAYSGDYWFTILENNLYINFPSTPVGDRLIYIYLDQQPEDLTSSNLGVEPAVPVRYQELLKLGVLKRIAEARKDTLMRNNYDANYQEKISNMQEKMALQIPEFHSAIDTLPQRGRFRSGRYDYRYFSS